MIRSAQNGQVHVLTIDRHEQRNALSLKHVEGLISGLNEARSNGSRCLVITGTGSSFCSGADLDHVTDDGFHQLLFDLLQQLSALPMPVIAAVNGPAIGAGTQLAISCDLRVADPSARFMVPTARLGLAIDSWSVRRLASLAGGGAARAMLLGLDSLDAERAYGLGLADRIGTLDDALEWARSLTELAPLTLRYSKLALTSAAYQPADDEVEQALARCWASDDAKEAHQARLDRRPPIFQGH
jgi:enoyl-CoA hydratase